MSILKRLAKSFSALFLALGRLPRRLRQRGLKGLSRSRRQSQHSTQAGFILPTVVMVILVVTLITTAILFRSFDRAKNAGNFRVNQVVLNAATPALDRAKAKLDAAFEDPNLPRGTPSDISLTQVLEKDRYTLGDEVPLRLAVDLNGNSTIDATQANQALELRETMTTAWRFPVDTDGNGKFDSFTLYGLYYRSPNRALNGVDWARARMPIDARTPPQDDSSAGGACAASLGTSASLVGANGWFKSGKNGILKKSFFIYTATVPIRDVAELGLSTAQYETYRGNKAFVGLEYQQDRARIPLGNNAIAYEDDLDMFSGTPFRINGRIIVNSNLHAGENTGSSLQFYQVSSDESCFYEAENAKIIIGGNITNGFVGSIISWGSIDFDLFNGRLSNPNSYALSGTGNTSASNNASEVAYNTQAYEQRIAALVARTIQLNGDLSVGGSYPNQTVTGSDPKPVLDRVKERINAKTNPDPVDVARQSELEVWFRNRTRRVPFNEVPIGDPAFTGTVALQGAGTDLLRPQDQWIYPVDPDNNGTSNNNLSLNTSKPEATDPEFLAEKENHWGDRISIGNGLPANWFDKTANDFGDANSKQEIKPPLKWLLQTVDKNSPNNRYRQTHVRELVDLGLTDRDGFWETKAAELPENRLDSIGGLRVVTGAGVYLPWDDTISGADKVVWPDTLPQPPDPVANRTPTPTSHPYSGKIFYDHDNNPSTAPIAIDSGTAKRPYLKMRAAAVYHYAHDDDNNATTPAPPIACVATYYDPTDATTAQNRISAGDSGKLAMLPLTVSPSISTKNSLNGITYGPPTVSGRNAGATAELTYQSELIYPNGRLVNPRLAVALSKAGNERTLAEVASIDSTMCALQILGISGSISRSTTPTAGFPLPDGTIQEVSFLDGREVKGIEGRSAPTSTSEKGLRNNRGGGGTNNNSYDFQPANTAQPGISEYDLSIEFRQPLEIRATAIDLDLLRRQATKVIASGPTTEYMLPDSGIIYATRDDALPDASSKAAVSSLTGSTPLLHLAKHELSSDRVSASDFWLDPTRRPNGILLVNGSQLGRGNSNSFQDEEKGLILATNLPVYIKAQTPVSGVLGGFNTHDHQEFNTTLTADWSNFYTRTENDFNTQFACRQNDDRLPGKCLPNGDRWRAASVLSDSLTLLSENFRFGYRNEGDYDLRNNQTDNLFRTVGTGSALYNLSTTGNPLANIVPATDTIRRTLETAGDTSKAAATGNIDSIEEKRLRNGFWDNNFVTNGLTSNNGAAFGMATGYTDSNYVYTTAVDAVAATTIPDSSYFNNFVTPTQRRRNGPEYLMEMCPKLPVSECGPDDWVVNEAGEKASDMLDTIPPPPNTAVGTNAKNSYGITTHEAGTTAAGTNPAKPNLQKYPRRVAFLRRTSTMANAINATTPTRALVGATLPPNNNDLILDAGGFPIPLAIGSAGTIRCYSYKGTVTLNTAPTPLTPPVWSCDPLASGQANQPRTQDNALWFRPSGTAIVSMPNPTTDSTLKSNTAPAVDDYTTPANFPLFIENQSALNGDKQQQPRLVPVLQLHTPNDTSPRGSVTAADYHKTKWRLRAPDTRNNLPRGTFNLVMATGDTPSRYRPSGVAEFNGAVSNLPRFLENWSLDQNNNYSVTIQGSFIQLKRSAYATGPFWQLLNTGGSNSFFSYAQEFNNFTGKQTQAYEPPARLWGFDVGLLSQLPDLFAQRFTLPPTDDPNEYYREVSREDDWIETLLCATVFDPTNPTQSNPPWAVNTSERPKNITCRR